jgi:O-antigen/teichoic acid export membrane protein
VSRTDLSTVFFFNIGAGAGAAALLSAAAPFVASFYDQPRLEPLLRVLSLSLVIGSFSIVHAAMLAKKVDFKTQMKIRLPANVLGGFTGIGLAVAGMGVWALVGQMLARSLANTALFWWSSDWRPHLVFDRSSLRRMLPFGSRLLAVSLLDKFFNNFYYLVIGKVFSPVDVGLYQRARNLQGFPTLTITASVNKVLFPLLSGIQDQHDRLRRGMQRTLVAVSSLQFPLMTGLAASAPTLVLVLLTEKWLPSVPYLQLLCIAGALHPIHGVNLTLLKALGRGDLFLRLEIIKKILVVLALVCTVQLGVLWIVIGQVVVSVLSLFVNTRYSARLIDYSLWAQARALAPPALASLSMLPAVLAAGRLTDSSPPLSLIAQIATGVGVYVLASHLLGVPVLASVRDLFNRPSDRT